MGSENRRDEMSRMFNKSRWCMILLFGAAALTVVPSCGSESSSSTEELGDGVARHALSQMGTCEDLASYAKNAAIQRLTAYAETQKAAIDQCWDYGQGVDAGTDTETDTGGASGSDADADADGDADDTPTSPVDGDIDGDFDEGNGGGKEGDGDHTETNVQEKGVDEADIVKTDGEYLYVLGGNDLIIVDAGDDGVLTEAGRIEVLGNPSELFIYGDLAVVFSNLGTGDVPDSMRMSRPEWSTDPSGKEPPSFDEPGMDWDYEGDYYEDGYTQIAIIDITDRSSPTMIRNIKYAGSYVTSRRIDGSLRAVLSTSTPALDIPFNIDWYDYCSLPETVGKAVFQAAYGAFIEEATKLIDGLSEDDILPKKIDQTGNESGVAETIVECTEVYGPGTTAGTGLLTVVTLDLGQPEAKQNDIAVFGEKGLVYASTTSLYLTSSNEYVQQAWSSGMWTDETSGIHKFDISSDASRAIYKATGTVTGRMLNQFCLGEHEGYLRVATTTGDEWNSDTWDNHISVFEEKDRELELVGKLSGIGKEEREEIYAARFMGDRGFLVTFRQTDPFFTFDLSDPYKPTKVGEWHGPGFSTYLHPYGENHIIALGRENWMLAISLYDLTDFANPALVERVFPGSADGNYEGEVNSVALDEHKAVTFDDSRDLLALPYHGWVWDEYQEEYDTGIMLYNVSANGFESAGDLSIRDPENTSYYNNEGSAQRSVFIGDILYGLSRCRITSATLDNPTESLDTLALYTGDSCNNSGASWDDVDEGEWDGGDTDVDMDGDGDSDSDTDTPVEPDTDSAVDTDGN